MSSARRTMPAGSAGATVRLQQAAALLIVLALVPMALSARTRSIRKAPALGSLVVGAEYRIPAHPDSPWLESVAAAAGSSSGMVVWTESGPGDQESTVRFARLGTDGHPIDPTGRPLLENGHYQRHVAIDAFNDRFVVAWCDIADKNQIVALRLDAAKVGGFDDGAQDALGCDRISADIVPACREHAAEILRPRAVYGAIDDHASDAAGTKFLGLGRKAKESINLALGE